MINRNSALLSDVLMPGDTSEQQFMTPSCTLPYPGGSHRLLYPTAGYLERGLSSQEADSVVYQKSCCEADRRIICEFFAPVLCCVGQLISTDQIGTLQPNDWVQHQYCGVHLLRRNATGMA